MSWLSPQVEIVAVPRLVEVHANQTSSWIAALPKLLQSDSFCPSSPVVAAVWSYAKTPSPTIGVGVAQLSEPPWKAEDPALTPTEAEASAGWTWDFGEGFCRAPAEATVALCGLAFKGEPETNDLRDSPALAIAEALGGQVGRLVGHDPVVGDTEIDAQGITPLPLDAAAAALRAAGAGEVKGLVFARSSLADPVIGQEPRHARHEVETA